MEIGAEGARTTSCPTCARPLALDAPRCPGCGTYLLLGVPAKRAGIFLVSGAVIGLVVGGSLIGSVVAARLAVVDGAAAQATPAVVTGGTTPVASVAPGGGPASAIPATAQAALRQAIAMNGRLAATTVSLAAALEADQLDTHAIATLLRSVTADAAVGATASTRLESWDGAATLGPALADAYGRIRAVARDGLAARLSNEPAYRAAADAMLEELAALAGLDASARALAADADIEVPAAP
jgi:hypothetical protein